MVKNKHIYCKFKDSVDHIRFMQRLFKELLIKKGIITEEEFRKTVVELAKKDKRKISFEKPRKFMFGVELEEL